MGFTALMVIRQNLKNVAVEVECIFEICDLIFELEVFITEGKLIHLFFFVYYSKNITNILITMYCRYKKKRWIRNVDIYFGTHRSRPHLAIRYRGTGIGRSTVAQ